MLPVLPFWQRLALAIRIARGSVAVVRGRSDSWPDGQLYRFEVMGWQPR